ncbi:hypothetical protein STSV1pORF17 [Sulfolobus virus STSV1]|uniref:hypothetical protein n=1 Tax=Sulfolobus virus STSV1 TaxID=285013 RepID=UPI000042B0FF|nr:hypothetical protein STSV1pORF17 [Sulfolobus virus STSV1]CAH04200.1 hypothetical protein [Sulfolobus virus STSV1]
MIDIVPDGLSKESWESIREEVAQDQEGLQFLQGFGLENPENATLDEIIYVLSKILRTLEDNTKIQEYLVHLQEVLQMYVHIESWRDVLALNVVYVVPEYENERAKKAHRILMFYFMQHLQLKLNQTPLTMKRARFVRNTIKTIREMVFNI